MILTLHTIKRLPKGQITHNIIAQIRAPIAHVFRWGPVLWFRGAVPKMLAPSAYIVHDERLGGPKCAVGECMIKDAAPECVFVAINLAVSIESSGGSVDSAVPLSFLDIGFAGAVDFP